jgi:hypothetical protein
MVPFFYFLAINHKEKRFAYGPDLEEHLSRALNSNQIREEHSTEPKLLDDLNFETIYVLSI